MTKVLACFLFVAACGAPGGGGTGDDDSGGPDAGATAASRWDGTSHISAPDGAVYDSTWVFAVGPDGMYQVERGEVVITTQPASSSDCTITIDGQRAMAPRDGTMMLDDASGVTMVRGQGDTIWVATYTSVCPDGSTSTQMLPYAAAWWPLPSSGAVSTSVVNGVATIAVDAELGTGTVTLTQE